MDANNTEKESDLVGEAGVDYSTYSKSQFLDDIERRLKLFMLRCVKVCRTLPRNYDAQHFGHQLIRSSSPAAANFRRFDGAEVRKSLLLNSASRLKN